MGLHLSTLASAAVTTKTQTTYLEALRLLLGWLARPKLPHDWSAQTLGPNTGGISGMELRPGNDTGHGQQRRWQRGGGHFRSSRDPRHEASLRPSPASRAGGAWNRDPPAHQRRGCWCSWWRAGMQNIIKSSWVSTFACSSRRTCDHQKDWHCGSFQLLSPITGISGAAGKWSLLIRASEARTSLEKQANTTPAFHWTWQDISSCFPSCSYSKTHEAKDSSYFSLLVHASDKGNGKRVETAPLSPTANHATYPQTRRCERGSRCQRQKSERGAEARRLEELQQCATSTKNMPACPWLCPRSLQSFSSKDWHSNAKSGSCLEKAFTRALTRSTSNVGRVFLCIFNAAILNVTTLQFSFWTLPADRRSTDNLMWLRQCWGGLL